jgi:hypothetical protein
MRILHAWRKDWWFMVDGPPADEDYCYMTSVGHKSGRPHSIEIWFVEHGGRCYIVAGPREKTHWLQNILHNPSVTFRVGRRDDGVPERPGRGRVVDEPALAAEIAALMDAKYNWSDGTIVELAYDPA